MGQAKDHVTQGHVSLILAWFDLGYGVWANSDLGSSNGGPIAIKVD